MFDISASAKLDAEGLSFVVVHCCCCLSLRELLLMIFNKYLFSRSIRIRDRNTLALVYMVLSVV
jgi:hypothetical protein